MESYNTFKRFAFGNKVQWEHLECKCKAACSTAHSTWNQYYQILFMPQKCVSHAMGQEINRWLDTHNFFYWLS